MGTSDSASQAQLGEECSRKMHALIYDHPPLPVAFAPRKTQVRSPGLFYIILNMDLIATGIGKPMVICGLREGKGQLTDRPLAVC